MLCKRSSPPPPRSFLSHSPTGTSGDSLVFLRSFSDTLSSPSGGAGQPLSADMILPPEASSQGA